MKQIRKIRHDSSPNLWTNIDLRIRKMFVKMEAIHRTADGLQRLLLSVGLISSSVFNACSTASRMNTARRLLLTSASMRSSVSLESRTDVSCILSGSRNHDPVRTRPKPKSWSDEAKALILEQAALTTHNENPKPRKGVKSAGQILASLKRFFQKQ
jgi:hypothetical protein